LGDDPWWEYGAMNDEPWNASGASRSMTTIESLRYFGDSYFSSRRALNPYGFMEAAHDQQVYERIAYETAVRDMMAGRITRDDFREEWGDYFVGRFQSNFTMTEATQLAKFIDPKYNLFNDIVLNPDMANPNSVFGGYLLYSGMDAEVLTSEEQFAKGIYEGMTFKSSDGYGINWKERALSGRLWLDFLNREGAFQRDPNVIEISIGGGNANMKLPNSSSINSTILKAGNNEIINRMLEIVDSKTANGFVYGLFGMAIFAQATVLPIMYKADIYTLSNRKYWNRVVAASATGFITGFYVGYNSYVDHKVTKNEKTNNKNN